MTSLIEVVHEPEAADRSVPKPGSASARAIAQLPMQELLSRMTPNRARKALGLVAWLLGPERRDGVVGLIVEELCERFQDAGLPIDRYGSATSMITAEHDAIGRVWTRGMGVTERAYVRPDEVDLAYLDSPFHDAALTGQWVELWLADTPESRFGIVPELKRAEYTHYLCLPMTLTNAANGWLTFATLRDGGFSELDLLTLAFLAPALATRIDARVGWSSLAKLLRTYVGDEPHTAILAGRAKRGQVSTIRAAMLIADLRDSTGHTAGISAVQAVGLINDLFDCLVPPIESRRGEVLKYLGDGLLAIFREPKDASSDAADRALEAALAAQASVETYNRSHPGQRPLQVGVALHYGETAYGNVGSGARLDFTVIGRDVGLASRIAGLNGKLNEPVLLSAAFVARAHGSVQRIGLHQLRGFEEPVEIFRPVSREQTGSAVRPAYAEP